MNGSEVKSYKVQSLQRMLEEGRFAIPQLQREFVWQPRKVCDLLDSMYRSYPIGTAMIWDTPRGHSLFLRHTLHALPHFDRRNKRIWYLIDGQQRLSVLHRVKEGGIVPCGRRREVDFDRVVFDLEAGGNDSRFAYRKPVEGALVSVAQILRGDWRRQLADLNARQIARVKDYRDRLLAYELPLIFVRTGGIEEVRSIFVRINSLGTPVGSADRAFARASRFDLRHLVNQARLGLTEDFRDLGDLTFLATLAFALGERNDVGERPISAILAKVERDLDQDATKLRRFERTWKSVAAAIAKAIDYLRTHFGVLNAGFLPSEYMVATLAIYIYESNGRPSAKAKSEIRKWFWATGVCSRYSGSGYRTNILEDLKFFSKLARTDRTRFSFDDRIAAGDLRRASYARKSSLGDSFFCLLIRQKPRHFDEGDLITLAEVSARANSSQKHHLFPKRLMANKKISASQYNSICNICLISAEENQQIGFRRPRTYLGEIRTRRHFKTTMKSHLIPYGPDSGLWQTNIARGFKTFMKTRQRELCRAFEKEAGIRLFRED